MGLASSISTIIIGHRRLRPDLLGDGLQVEGAQQRRVLYLLDGRWALGGGWRVAAAALAADEAPRTAATLGAPTTTPRLLLPGNAARGGGGARRALALVLSSAARVGCVLDGTGV